MNDERWPDVKKTLGEMLDLEPSARQARLTEIGRIDPGLRSAVESLLASENTPSDFLEPPVGGVAVELALDAGEAVAVGTQVGAYRLVSLIGSGGMGAVYRAVRTDGQFEQEVAVKLIRRGMGSKEILHRFHRERQTLAGLDHAGIARLLDGGATDDGRPYLVLEHVDGRPIDSYCDARGLSIVERLGLFGTVCSAVHYAHQNLIVHRDLKPKNILVTGDGVPKLLDFGISKLLTSDLVPGQDPTVTAMRVMTPQYASPEQIRGEPITTASDVYSLGVILYGLLTGHRPYHIKHDDPHQAAMVIRESRPDTPSEAITRTEEVVLADGTTSTITPESVSLVRGESPDRLRRRLQGDLDTIVMTAMHKDPKRRYSSVQQLSEDIRRYLRGLPVTARRDTFLYRAGKFIRRNKVATIAFSVAILSLIAGTIGTSVGMLRARAALEQAEKETRKAELQARKAERINEFMQNMLASADPFNVGAQITVRSVVDEAAHRIDNELADEWEINAALHNTLGMTYLGLGLYTDAQQQVRAGLSVLDRVGVSCHPEVAKAKSILGEALFQLGEYATAETHTEEALAIRRSLKGSNDPDVATDLNNLGKVRQAKGDYAGAEAAYRQALEIRRSVFGDNTPQIARSLSNIGVLRTRQGKYAAAEPLLREALTVFRKTLPPDHPDIAVALNNLGMLFYEQGARNAALPLFRESLELRRKTLGMDHPRVAEGMNNLALALLALGDYEAAEKLFRQALDLRKRQLGNSNPKTALSMTNLAGVLRKQGMLGEAEQLCREALEAWRTTLGDNHPHVAACQTLLAALLHERGDDQRAEVFCRRALETRLSVLPGEHPDVADSLALFGLLRTAAGDPEGAEPHLRESLRILRLILPPDHHAIAETKSVLGECLLAQDRFDEAESLLVSSFSVLSEAKGGAYKQTLEAANRVICLYEAWDKPDKAAEWRAKLPATQPSTTGTQEP